MIVGLDGKSTFPGEARDPMAELSSLLGIQSGQLDRSIRMVEMIQEDLHRAVHKNPSEIEIAVALGELTAGLAMLTRVVELMLIREKEEK